MALRGFLPVEDPRMKGTIEAVQRELTREGFVYRYHVGESDDGLAGEEAPFLFCNFWLVDCLALQGKTEEATELFEKTLAVANDLGLLAEEYDLDHKRLLGNYPQAFSHIGVIISAYLLTQRKVEGLSTASQETLGKTSWKEEEPKNQNRRTEEPFFVAVREKAKSRSARAAFCKMVDPSGRISNFF